VLICDPLVSNHLLYTMLCLLANILAQCPSCKGHGKNQNEGGEEEGHDGPKKGDGANDDAAGLQGETEEEPVDCGQWRAHGDALVG